MNLRIDTKADNDKDFDAQQLENRQRWNKVYLCLYKKLLNYDCILCFILNIIFFEEYTQYDIKIKSNIYIDLYDKEWLRYSGIIEELFKINSIMSNF